MNCTKAAVRAGYSEKTARQQGARLLSNVYISECIEVGRRTAAEETGTTIERLLQELHRIGFADLRQLYDEQGHLKSINELPDEIAVCVSSVKVRKRTIPRTDGEIKTTTEVKVWDKPKSPTRNESSVFRLLRDGA